MTVVTHGILTSQSGKLRLLTLNYFATALMGEFTYFKWCIAKPHLSSVLLITPSQGTSVEVPEGNWNLQLYSKALQFIRWKESFVVLSAHGEANGINYTSLGLNEISVLL